MVELWVPIIAIICAIGLPVVFGIMAATQAIRSRHQERMAMIEKGFILEEPEKKANRYPALRNGMVMIGLALGIIVGIFMYPVMPVVDDWLNLAIPTMAILFAGIAFVLYFFLSRKMQLKEGDNDTERL